ncbi:PadR family transcriptional regulator [Nonomuraea guangzhouensis]|uniref:PadR family transcriptional regulator n=1 Tax=Nonomuraea guangzhouensis TaxID=1291555 RepID=UPI0027E140D0|nr:PadR family transcriptional regulator [Nonomuraea guangzhouensis]
MWVAQRRRVANLLALSVLTVVAERPMHPYEMASVLRARGKDREMPIKWGSFYTVVRNLEKHGLIRATESARQGGRPERTVYRITEDGREEAEDWTRELLGTPEREHTGFEAGLSVMGGLDPDEVTALLRRRLALLRDRIAVQRSNLEVERGEIPRLFLIESEYALAMSMAEEAWTGALLAELTIGTFPGLAQWQGYHQPNQPPPTTADPPARDLTARALTTGFSTGDFATGDFAPPESGRPDGGGMGERSGLAGRPQ